MSGIFIGERGTKDIWERRSIMKNWKRILIISVTGAAFAASGMASDARVPGRIGIPNPLVEYDSYAGLEQVVGFEPLFLTRSFGYKVDDYIAISRETADIRYSNDEGAHLAVRSAKSGSMKDISGVYSVDWKKKKIGHTEVYTAKVDKDSFAAHWTSGGFAFAVTGDGMDEKTFMSLLSGYFVDMTEHYYNDDPVSVTGQKAF